MKKLLFTGAFLLAAVAAFNVLANDTIETEEFVEEASAKGLAEIETARMALRKATSMEVKEFAQKMIDDHTAANKELANIARNKGLETADDVELMNKAKAFILKLREGESFDVAYANNQVSAHENTIELFRKASRSRDNDIKAFAEKTLPKLQNHLKMARELVQTTKAAESRDDMREDNRDAVRDDLNEDTRDELNRRNNTEMDTRTNTNTNTNNTNNTNNQKPRTGTNNLDTDTGVGSVPPTQYSD